MIGLAIIVGMFALCWLSYDRGRLDERERDKAWQLDLAVEQTIRNTIRAELGTGVEPPSFRRVLPLFDQDAHR